MQSAGPISAFVWKVESKPVSVSLSLDALDRLNFAVMEAFLALPRRGLEIGGLLLGNVRSGRDFDLVEVDDFEPVECDHATGPSYLLSGADRAALERRVRRDTGGQTSIVGFFRSHTRDEFAARDADLGLMRNLFPDPAKVLLLIRPHRDRPADAGFLIWEDHAIRSIKPYSEFPFRRAALFAGGYEIVSRAGPSGAVQEAPAIATAPTAPVARELTPQLVWPESERSQHWTWNTSRIRAEEWLVAAGLVVFAILSRVHGNALTPTQVQEHASIPRTAVLAPPPESPAVESPAPVVTQEKFQPPTAAPPDAVASRIDKRDRVVTRRRTMAAPPPLSVQEVVQLPAAPVPSAAAIYSLPSRTEALLALSESPSNSAVSPKIPPVAPSVANPLVSVAVDPVRPPAPRGGVLHKLGFGGKGEALPIFTPPKAIHEPAAELSPRLVRDMNAQVPVDVKVYIDRAGKVKYAELLSKGTGRDRDLASLAVFTSRHWEFSPARLEGEPVEAEVILHFRFGPESR